jgi:DNA-binding MarR family transcriptional regulator
MAAVNSSRPQRREASAVVSPRPPGSSRGHAAPGDVAAGQSDSAENDAADLARSIWLVVSDFVHRYDPRAELRRALGLGRGSGRVRAIVTLAQGPLTLAELARRIDVDPPYATIIANELEALGLLTRTQDVRDRRRRPVELTARGHAAARTAQDIITRPPPPLRDMPSADLRRLRELLDQLSLPPGSPSAPAGAARAEEDEHPASRRRHQRGPG